MAKVEIIIDEQGVIESRLTDFTKEDPACYAYQRVIATLKDSGVKVVDSKVLNRQQHGHTHDFERHKH